MQKNETQPPPYSILKKNSRWKKGLNMNGNTIKALEKNIGRKISDIPHSNIFTNMSPRIKKMGSHQNKNNRIFRFCMGKENNIKMKREPTVWKNIVANDT